MARTYTQLNANTDIFQVWFDRTNTMLNAFSETVTLKANTVGDTSSGNGFISGTFGATTLVGTNLRGGSVSTPGLLTITSNTTFSGSLISASSNVDIEATHIVLSTNSSVEAISIASNGASTNTTIGGTNLRIFANTLINGTAEVSGNLVLNGSLTGNVNIDGVTTYNNDLVVNASLIDSLGSPGSSNQALISNGSAVYWGTLISGGGYYKGSNGSFGDANNKTNLFRINANTLTQNVTFIAGENASAVGPVDLDPGVTITVQTGARVVII